ncbi:MAG: DNA starvation/stationary phase protection protein [Balneolaceae bacterium]|nr:DNA starvation/stationary phase protection protein [Balneolaceae bacterium]
MSVQNKGNGYETLTLESEKNRKEIAEGLSHLLADSYMVYLKTHNYHWNVTGELFHPLHEQFEQQYTELAEAIDEIAERIRALGHKSPGSFSEFSTLTSIKEDTEKPKALEMVRRLAIAMNRLSEQHERLSLRRKSR